MKKTKKKKKLSKSFTVNVAAKETPASSETPASQDASKNPVVKLEKINVSAGETKISEKGGQTKVTVTSATDGAEIIKTTFKSSNEQFATVDADGVVTGVNPGTVTITASAQDKNDLNNIVTGTVTIVVSELLKSTVTLTAEDQKLDMLVGDTHTLKPIATRDDKSAPELVYTSSDEKVVTVSGDGTVKAVGEGSATITVVDKGTTGQATCSVTVTATGLGITSANATHADTIEVTMNKNVSTADIANVKITLVKTGTEVKDIKASFDAAGRVYTIKSTNGNFTEGEYTVSVTSPGDKVRLSKDTAELSKTFKVEAAYAKTLKIKENQVVPYSGQAKIYYNVVDQYGDSFKVLAKDIDWSIEAENSKIKFTSAVFSSNTSGTNDKYVLVNLNAQENISAGSTEKALNGTSTETIKIGGEVKAKPTAKDSTSFTVKPVKISSVKIDSVNTTDASGNAIKLSESEFSMTQTDAAQEISLNWSGVDENGAAVDPEVYATGSYSTILYFEPSVAGVTFTKDEKTAKDGTFTISVPATVASDFTIAAKAGLEKSTFTIHVNPKAVVSNVTSVSSNAEIRVHAGDQDVKIPIKFTDQYGKAATAIAGSAYTDFITNKFNVAAVNGNNVEGYGAVATGLTYTPGDPSITLDMPNLVSGATKGSFDLTFEYTGEKLKGGTYTPLKLTFSVVPKSTAQYLAAYGDFGTDVKIINGQRPTLTFYVQDSDKAVWNTNDDTYTAKITGDSDVTGLMPATTIALTQQTITLNGKATQCLAGSVQFNNTSSTTLFSDKKLNLQLMKGTKPLETLTYKVTLAAKPAKLSLSADKTDYTAGQDITITATAQDANNNTVTTYAGSQKDVAISVGTDSFKRDITFNNGVAKVVVPATTVQSGVTCGFSFAPGDGFTSGAVATSAINIKAGDVSGLKVVPTDNIGIVVSSLDSKENATVLAGKVVTIAVKKNGEDITKDSIKNVDAEKKVTLGSAGEFNLKANIVAPATIDVTYNGITKTFTLESNLTTTAFGTNSNTLTTFEVTPTHTNANPLAVTCVVALKNAAGANISSNMNTVVFSGTNVTDGADGSSFTLTKAQAKTGVTVTATVTAKPGYSVGTKGSVNFVVTGLPSEEYSVDDVTPATAFTSGTSKISIKDQYGDAFTLASALSEQAMIASNNTTSAKLSIAKDGTLTTTVTGTPAVGDTFTYTYLTKTITIAKTAGGYNYSVS